MEQKQSQQEVLLLEDKKERTLGVVSEIDKTGKVKTVAPKDENSQQFLKINQKNGMLQNFTTNDDGFEQKYSENEYTEWVKWDSVFEPTYEILKIKEENGTIKATISKKDK